MVHSLGVFGFARLHLDLRATEGRLESALSPLNLADAEEDRHL